MYRFFSRLYPRRVKKEVSKLLVFSGSKKNADQFLGAITVSSLVSGLIVGLILGIWVNVSFIWLFLLGASLVPIIVFGMLYIDQDNKAKAVETILPDALQLMGSNLRAGYTVDRALLLSARPEFGVFKDELEKVGREIAAGKEVAHALLEMTKRVRSKKLDRVIELIVSGLKSGGGLADLLQQTAADLRTQTIVERKIRTNVSSYVIFIFVAIGIAAPLLFGLSSFLSDVIRNILGGLELPETGNIPFTLGEVTLTTEFILQFIATFLIVNSIFGSFVIGMISSGKAKDGAKYIIPLILIGLTVFFVIRLGVGSLLGGVFSF